ncbi:MAG: ubiquitin-like protein [Sulfobacillus sp.]
MLSGGGGNENQFEGPLRLIEMPDDMIYEMCQQMDIEDLKQFILSSRRMHSICAEVLKDKKIRKSREVPFLITYASGGVQDEPLVLEIPKMESISGVKTKIGNVLKVSPNRLTIIFGGRTIPDERILSEVRVPRETIYVFVEGKK